MAPCMLTLPHVTGRSPPYTTVNTKPHPLGPQGLDSCSWSFFSDPLSSQLQWMHWNNSVFSQKGLELGHDDKRCDEKTYFFFLARQNTPLFLLTLLLAHATRLLWLFKKVIDCSQSALQSCPWWMILRS